MNVQGLKLEKTKTTTLVDEWDVKLGETVIGRLTETEDGVRVGVWAITAELNQRRFASKAEAVEAILAHIVALAFVTDHVTVQVSPKRFIVAEAADRTRRHFKVRTKPLPSLMKAEQVRQDMDYKFPDEWSEQTNGVQIEEESEL